MAEKLDDDDEINEEAAKNDETGEQAKKKKIIIIAGAAFGTLLIIGAIIFFIMSNKNHEEANTQAAENKPAASAAVDQKGQLVYYDLDDFIVNLSKNGEQPSFLKMSVTLEIDSADNVIKIQNKLPVIRDTFQTYLRELRPEDLQGSEGVYRLKQELLMRLNKITYPTNVSDILFRDLLIQ